MGDDRYFIECKKCEMQVTLIPLNSYDFMCPRCKKIYDYESGVRDKVIEEGMYKLYLGAKRGGLIREKDTLEEFWVE